MTKINVTSIDTEAFHLNVHILHAIDGRNGQPESRSTPSSGVPT